MIKDTFVYLKSSNWFFSRIHCCSWHMRRNFFFINIFNLLLQSLMLKHCEGHNSGSPQFTLKITECFYEPVGHGHLNLKDVQSLITNFGTVKLYMSWKFFDYDLSFLVFKWMSLGKYCKKMASILNEWFECAKSKFFCMLSLLANIARIWPQFLNGLNMSSQAWFNFKGPLIHVAGNWFDFIFFVIHFVVNRNL